MATTIERLQAVVTADTRDAEAGLGRVGRSADGAQGALGRLGSIGTGAAKVGLAAIATGAAAASAAVGALAAKALTGGWDRLTGIENAEAKLRGLGHSADSVKTIMDSALKAVKGTAYGLDDAAKIAASAVAAGVKPGQDLERTLKLVADAATIGGTSMSEMGLIFNKVAAGNKMQAEEANMLLDRGIPIWNLLAKTLGKTTAEVQKMGEKGQISFDMFRKAVESGMGGAALKSGETMTGTLANMNAALSRLGAEILKGAFPELKKVFGDATKELDKLGPAATTTGRIVGRTLAGGIQLASDAFRVAGPIVRDISKGFELAGTGARILFDALREGGSAQRRSILSEMFPPDAVRIIDRVLGAVRGVVDSVGRQLDPTLQALRPVLDGVLVVARTAAEVGFWLLANRIELVGKAAELIMPGLQRFGGFVQTNVLPGLQRFGEFVSVQLLPGLDRFRSQAGEQLPGALAGLGAAVQGQLQWVGTLAGHFKAGADSVGGIEAAVGRLGQVFVQAQQVIGPIMADVQRWAREHLPQWRASWGELGGTVREITETVFQILGVVVVRAMDLIGSKISMTVEGIRIIWSKFGADILAVASSAFGLVHQAIKTWLELVSGALKVVLRVLQDNWSGAWQAIKDTAFRVAYVEMPKLMAAAGQLIVDQFKLAGRMLFEAGRAVIQGLLDGIESKTGDLRVLLARVTATIPMFKGPPSKDAVLLYPAGQSVMDGLIGGVESRFPAFQTVLGRATAMVSDGWAGLRRQLDAAFTAPGMSQDAVFRRRFEESWQRVLADPAAMSKRWIVTDDGSIQDADWLLSLRGMGSGSAPTPSGPAGMYWTGTEWRTPPKKLTPIRTMEEYDAFRGGGRGLTQNIYAAPGMNERQLAAKAAAAAGRALLGA